MKLRTKLLVGGMLPLLLVAVVGLALWTAGTGLARADRNMNATDQIIRGVLELSFVINQYLLYGHERPMAQFDSICAFLTRSLDEYRPDTPQEGQILEDVRDRLGSIESFFRLLVGSQEGSGAPLHGETETAFRTMLVSLTLANSREIVSLALNLNRVTGRQADAIRRRAALHVALSVLAFGTLIVAYHVWMSRGILRPVAKLIEGTKRIAGGDLSHRIEPESDDEIGRLTRAFNVMIAELDKYSASLRSEIEVRERAEARLRYFSSRLVTAQEEERKRVAGEIHDGIGQQLTVINFKSEKVLRSLHPLQDKALVEGLQDLVTAIKEAMEEVRRIQLHLRPSIIDDVGILATLSWLCRGFQETYSAIGVEQEVSVREDEVPDPLKPVIYRITQEALTNVAKHSRADAVSLLLRKNGDAVELTIRDNGHGLSLATVAPSDGAGRGFGLTSMRERAELSGGSCTIRSDPGGGTVVHASWPLQEGPSPAPPESGRRTRRPHEAPGSGAA
ncbi:MAG: HAMP domain-containing protein [bacterium]